MINNIKYDIFLASIVFFSLLIFVILSLLFLYHRKNYKSKQAYLENQLREFQLIIEDKDYQIIKIMNENRDLINRNVQLEEKMKYLQKVEDNLAFVLQEKNQILIEKAYLNSSLEQSKNEINEKNKSFEIMKNQFLESFKALAAEALSANNESFLVLAKSTFEQFQESNRVELNSKKKDIFDTIVPVQQTLKEVDLKLKELEKERVGSYQVLKHQVGDLIILQKELRTETSKLVNALKAPHVRGQWGEIQLKRVVELAGMLPHCDFIEQSNVDGSNNRLRPDMIIRLPGKKIVIIDAKAPLSAYLESLEAESEELRKKYLKEHSRQVRQHIKSLSQRTYWSQFSTTPEFVILFLPGEPFFSAALENDPTLIELGVQERVILSTPSTLIALLRTIAYGWQQESITKNTQVIRDLGKDLYKRIQDFSNHMSNLGKNLSNSVSCYNQTIGSLEHRVLVTARKFQNLDIGLNKDSLPEFPIIEEETRIISSKEF